MTVNGVRIHYEATGQGRPMLLLHGNGEDHHIFGSLSRRFSKRFCVYTPDTRCHGKSGCTGELHYTDMMEDAAEFIRALGLEKPVLIGFSDGGITGLLLAIKYPHMLSRLVVCGASTQPQGMKKRWLYLMKLGQLASPGDAKLNLMLNEPDIRPRQLARIAVPTLVLAGSRDMIYTRHTRALAGAIPHSRLHILPGEDHGSYVVNSDKLAVLARPFLTGL